MRILAALVAACLVASLAQVIIIYIVLVEVLFTSLFIFSTLSSESYVYIKKNNFLCMSLVLWSCSPFYSRFIEESNNLNHGRRNIGWPRKYYRLLWMCQSNFNIRKKLIKRVLAIKNVLWKNINEMSYMLLQIWIIDSVSLGKGLVPVVRRLLLCCL